MQGPPSPTTSPPAATDRALGLGDAPDHGRNGEAGHANGSARHAHGTGGNGATPPPGRRYCLITPARDEARFGGRTLASVAAQTVPPAKWVVVDDGSRDATPALLAEWADRLPYLETIRRPDRGDRKLGGGVIDAFYDGYARIDPADYDYVCKLDLDLDLPPGYFEGLMRRMEADERLATISGKPYFPVAGPDGTERLVSEACGDENSVGMTKFYRTSAFEQVGGFVRELMWDGIDGHECRRRGWRAASVDDPSLRFVHLRPMGTSHKNWWTGRVRHGYGQWFMGTGPLYMIASAVYRMTRPPLIVGGLAMLWGYFGAMLRGVPRYGDPDPAFRRFLRSFQRRILLRGKSRATAELDARQASAWRPPAGVPARR